MIAFRFACFLRGVFSLARALLARTASRKLESIDAVRCRQGPGKERAVAVKAICIGKLFVKFVKMGWEIEKKRRAYRSSGQSGRLSSCVLWTHRNPEPLPGKELELGGMSVRFFFYSKVMEITIGSC